MKNFAVIESGKVVNAVVAEDDYAAAQGWIELTNRAGVGWDYINGQFVDNRPKLEVIEPSLPTKEELLAQINVFAAQIQALPQE